MWPRIAQPLTGSYISIVGSSLCLLTRVLLLLGSLVHSFCNLLKHFARQHYDDDKTEGRSSQPRIA